MNRPQNRFCRRGRSPCCLCLPPKPTCHCLAHHILWIRFCPCLSSDSRPSWGFVAACLCFACLSPHTGRDGRGDPAPVREAHPCTHPADPRAIGNPARGRPGPDRGLHGLQWDRPLAESPSRFGLLVEDLIRLGVFDMPCIQLRPRARPTGLDPGARAPAGTLRRHGAGRQ